MKNGLRRAAGSAILTIPLNDLRVESQKVAPVRGDRCSEAKNGTRVLWLGLSAEAEDIKGSPNAKKLPR